MKRKIIASVLGILIYLFPFRYAFLDVKLPHALGLFCALISLFGFLAVFYFADSGDEQKTGKVKPIENPAIKQAA